MKKLALLFILSIVSLIPWHHAQAHVLESDGTIGAVMHVTPDDDPVAGQESSFFFEFKDTTGKFTPKNCDCTVSISKAGEVLTTQPLFGENIEPSLTNASFSYTFPEKNIYTIEVVGKPLIDGAFSSFSLRYDMRVEKSVATTPGESVSKSNWFMQHGIHFFPVIIGVLVVALFLVLKNVKHDRT